jgi:hypothetical protein
VVGGRVVAQKISYMKGGHKRDTPTFVFSLTTDGYPPGITEKKGVCHTAALPFTFKSILMQRKNYENSNISPCKNIIFQKSSYKNRSITWVPKFIKPTILYNESKHNILALVGKANK